MRASLRAGWLSIVLGFGALPAAAQERDAGKADALPPEAAATVNGQPIPEVAVRRGLKRLPPEKQAEARTEILDYLIDNVLIDQYLQQRRVEVSAKEVDARVDQVHEEIKKSGQAADKVLQELLLTEQELRAQILSDLRWEKFVTEQGTDKVLRELFAKNPDVFDGSLVRARHILVTPASKDPQAAEQAKQKVLTFKKQIEETAAQELAKLPATTSPEAREKARAQALEAAFADLAHKESACPSREQGGDVGWFPRAGNMVEPFAAAAFALKPYQLSDPVVTRFGCHLILATGRRPGRETKFEDVKDVVQEFFANRLRDYLASQLKPNAQIVVRPVAKP